MRDSYKSSRGALARVAAAAIALSVSALGLSGCRFVLGGNPDEPWSEAIPADFDFATVRSLALALDVSVRIDGAVRPYVGDIGVYAYREDGRYDLLGSGSADATGKAEFNVLVPTSLGSITIRPSTPGLFERDVALDPSSPSLALSISPDDLPGSASRALTQAGKANFKMVSDHDPLGVPAALDTPRPLETLPKAFLDDVGENFAEGSSFPSRHADIFVDGISRANVRLIKDAEVTVTFLHESAGSANTLGYYVYETSNPPAAPPEAISILVDYPNASYIGSGGGLKAGDRIKLVNPDDGGTRFRAGTTIAWVLVADGFKDGEVTEGRGRYYSTPAFNPESGSANDKAHAVLLLYDKPDRRAETSLIIGFEDSDRGSGDGDFNDAILSVSAAPFWSVIDVSGVAAAKTANDADADGALDSADQYPNDPSRSASVSWPSASTFGTALFEDRWPYLGDYDFNDVVANLRVTTVKNPRGEAVETIVETRLRAAGGGLPTALALALPVASSGILSVSGQSLTNGLFSIQANGVEEDGDNSVVPIYSDAHAEFGSAGGDAAIVNTVRGGATSPERVFTITISYAPGLAASRLSVSPDFFIVVGGDRSKEIHAIGKLPGRKANAALFGTADDGSVNVTGPYYHSKKGAPWALLVPAEIPWQIERTEISKAFLKFGAWVKSGGSSYADWYLDKSGYRDSGYLY